MSNKIAFIYSPELTRLGDIGTYPHGRSSRVHALVDACELLSSSSSSTTGPDVTVADDDAQYGNQRAKIIRPIPATSLDLLRYHDPRFVNQLLGSGFGLGEVGNESGSSASEDSDDIDGFERPRKRTRFDTVEKYGLVDVSVEISMGLQVGVYIFPGSDLKERSLLSLRSGLCGLS